MSMTNYKRISDVHKDIAKGNMLGIIYENYSNLTEEGKPKLVIQNEVNEIELNIPTGFVSNSLLVSGCAYIVKGVY
jgi:alpha-D-ribose 1-methylphosphonate 5-triphosphate synthase subunit PhnI